MTAPQEPDSSLVVRRDTTASRQQVWQVVADGWTYSQWVVVGNSRMRAVEPNWPALRHQNSPHHRCVAGDDR